MAAIASALMLTTVSRGGRDRGTGDGAAGSNSVPWKPFARLMRRFWRSRAESARRNRPRGMARCTLASPATGGGRQLDMRRARQPPPPHPEPNCLPGSPEARANLALTPAASRSPPNRHLPGGTACEVRQWTMEHASTELRAGTGNQGRDHDVTLIRGSARVGNPNPFGFPYGKAFESPFALSDGNGADTGFWSHICSARAMEKSQPDETWGGDIIPPPGRRFS
jgi:hypothetical protein